MSLGCPLYRFSDPFSFFSPIEVNQQNISVYIFRSLKIHQQMAVCRACGVTGQQFCLWGTWTTKNIMNHEPLRGKKKQMRNLFWDHFLIATHSSRDNNLDVRLRVFSIITTLLSRCTVNDMDSLGSREGGVTHQWALQSRMSHDSCLTIMD